MSILKGDKPELTMARKPAALLIRPKNAEESDFIARLIERLGVKSHRLTEDEVLDMGLAMMMRKVDKSKRVPEATVMKLLRR